MASLVDYGAALGEVKTRAEALALGYAGVHPKALFDSLRACLPILAEPVAAFRRPGQSRAQARLLAESEELLVTVAAAMHSRLAVDEDRAVEEAQRWCRLLEEIRATLLRGP